ncbi:MAG: VWA domain-containing protein [Deltaproteobacteria bacterium]|nr:VWA domain-containing protein [Deltaproteobacteria bacterium]
MSRKISSGAISLFLLLLAAGADAGTGAFSGGTPARIDLSICFTYPEGDPDAWRSVFNEASKLLYNATEKQVQLGRIRVFLNCPAKKEEADILIRRGDSPASAHLLGLGAKGTHIFLSEKHKSAAQGQFGIVPALGRHVFGLHPESQGRKRFIRLPGGTPLMTPAVDFFCPGCLMDGGTTVFPRQPEFCTNRSMGFTTSHEGGYVRSRIPLVFPGLGTADFGELYQTEQQIRNGKSAWETMVQVAGQRYGILLRPPEREPVDDAAGHADLVNGETWVVESCASKTLLVIDASSSMAGLRMELAQMAAKDSVALTESGNYLGVVSFATEATVNFPLQPLLDSSSRSAAQVAIDGIATGGWTSIGGALRAALNQILESPRTANESIILLTEGDHNAGEPPSEVIPDLVSAGVKVRSIALGPEANVTLLSQISQATGGTVEYASQAEQIIGIMPRLTTASAGNFPVKTVRGSIAPGGQASSTVLVDSFQQGAVFSLSWSAGILELVLQRPDGSVVGPGDSGVEHLASASSEFYRILQPAQGTWRCTVRAVNLSAPQNYTLQVLDRSLGVQITARAGNDPVAYPEAVQIQAYVVADGYPVAGAAVEAVITRPDGSRSPFPFTMTGSPATGTRKKAMGFIPTILPGMAGTACTPSASRW